MRSGFVLVFAFGIALGVEFSLSSSNGFSGRQGNDLDIDSSRAGRAGSVRRSIIADDILGDKDFRSSGDDTNIVARVSGSASVTTDRWSTGGRQFSVSGSDSSSGVWKIRYDSASRDVERLKKENSDLTASIAQLRKENAEFKEINIKLQAQVTVYQERITNNDFQTQVAELQRQVALLVNENNRLKVENARFKSSSDEFMVRIEKLNADLRDSHNQIKTLKDRIRELESSNDSSAKDRTIADLNEQINAFKNQVASLNKQIADLSDNNKNGSSKLQSLQDQLDRAMRTIQELRAQLGAAQDKYNAIIVDFKEYKAKFNFGSSQINEYQNAIDGYKATIAKLTAQVNDLQSQVNSKTVDYKQFYTYQAQVLELQQVINSLRARLAQGNAGDNKIVISSGSTSISASGEAVANGGTASVEVIGAASNNFGSSEEQNKLLVGSSRGK